MSAEEQNVNEIEEATSEKSLKRDRDEEWDDDDNLPKKKSPTLLAASSASNTADSNAESLESDAAAAAAAADPASEPSAEQTTVPDVAENNPTVQEEAAPAADVPAPAPAPAATPAVVPAVSTEPTAVASSTTTTTATGESQELLVLEVTPDKVGQIIGSKGMIIQEIQSRSGARAFVNQDFPDGVNRQVNITGTAAQVKSAQELINKIITEGPTAIHINSLAGGPIITQVIECSQPQVGKIIGTGGATIKELQSKSGARIQIDQDFPPEVPRKINLTGTAAAVQLGVQLVQNVMMGGTALMGLGAMGGAMGGGGMPGMMMGGALGPMQMVGAEAKQTMEVPKNVVGKIIGRGGETITMIQRKSGARVQVDQQVPEGTPCKVMMSGAPQSIGAAVQMLNEIMSGVPTNRIGANMGMMPPGGGGGGMGGAMGGGMMGGMGANPYAAAMGMAGGGMGIYGAGGAGAMGAYGGGGGMQQMQQMQQPGAMPGQGMYGAAAGMGIYGQPQAQQQQQAYGMPTAAYGAYGQQQPQPQVSPINAAAAAAAGAAAAGKMAGGGSVWTEHKTDEGVSYWYNATTGVSQWERPKNM